MSGKQASSAGISFPMALFLVFLVLKLCGVIGWSWWWVTAPLWGPLAVLTVVLLFCLAMAGIVRLVG